jgi:opacity protein-like surface antigen
VTSKASQESRFTRSGRNWLSVAKRIPVFHLLAAASVAVCIAPIAAAQDVGNGFLFQQPAGSFTISGGYAHANAGGDLFSFVTDTLSLSRGDFSGATFGADLAFRIAPRFDVALGTSYSGTSSSSSYRNLVDNNNQEITQETNFRRVPVMLSVHAYLEPRGRSVGKFAWVPARFAPYVGAGVGAMWYQFHQHGDFVDYQNNNVFPGDFNSSGWTPAGQGLAGVDFTLTPHLALTGEAKYIWANGKLNNTFSGFDSIDLSGLSTTIGLTFRY